MVGVFTLSAGFGRHLCPCTFGRLGSSSTTHLYTLFTQEGQISMFRASQRLNSWSQLVVLWEVVRPAWQTESQGQISEASLLPVCCHMTSLTPAATNKVALTTVPFPPWQTVSLRLGQNNSLLGYLFVHDYIKQRHFSTLTLSILF